MQISHPLIECVPNISEGRDMKIIGRITAEITEVPNVRLLGVDPGWDANRTVVTFIGPPEEVCEAAFRAVRKASELIDMSRHHGVHPRMGATDVCPLVPYDGITMEEVVQHARTLAERIGNALQIPVYCYEHAALMENRRELASCRKGEYEALRSRMPTQDGKPDFGPHHWNDHISHTGATAIGARKLLIAYNVNLNTTSEATAGEIAAEIREKGRIRREGDPETGRVIRDVLGHPVFRPGLLKSVRAIGWYMPGLKAAQVSMNLTDTDITPLHIAFDTVSQCAAGRGLLVTGSEIVGLVPLKTLLEAGRYFLEKRNEPTGRPETDLVNEAVKTLGLEPFDPAKKIIEYILK